MIKFKIKKNIRYFLCIYLFLLIPPSFASSPSSKKTKGIWINLGAGNFKFPELSKWNCSTTTIGKKYTLLFISQELYNKAVKDLSIENSPLNQVNGEQAKEIFTEAFSLLGTSYACKTIYKKINNEAKEVMKNSLPFEDHTDFTIYNGKNSPKNTKDLLSVSVPIFHQDGYTSKTPCTHLGLTLDTSKFNVTIFSDRSITVKVPIHSASWYRYDLSLRLSFFGKSLSDTEEKLMQMSSSSSYLINTKNRVTIEAGKKKTVNFKAKIPGNKQDKMQYITKVEATLMPSNKRADSFFAKAYSVYEENPALFIVGGLIFGIGIVWAGLALRKKPNSSDKSKPSRKPRSSRKERPRKRETTSSS